MIITNNLSKSFGTIKAVNDISFSIKQGEIVALLGPNGSGKTTLMRCITGFLEKDEGSVNIFGEEISDNRIKALKYIGYVPENSALYTDMSVFEFLEFNADIWGIKGEAFKQQLQKTVKSLKLEEVINQKIETLSKGFKKRVGIAAGILHDPRILILDEPTEGLDPNQKLDLRNFIKDYSKKGIVILSTHIMEEVEAIASRILLINRGKLIKDCSPVELKQNGDIFTSFHQLTK